MKGTLYANELNNLYQKRESDHQFQQKKIYLGIESGIVENEHLQNKKYVQNTDYKYEKSQIHRSENNDQFRNLEEIKKIRSYYNDINNKNNDFFKKFNNINQILQKSVNK